ncbi:MAG: glycerol dehydratase reactivase beta/small subunit family protein [Propionibacteriaceae bacterium]|jgi:pyrrolidone-carboxylate peptidase|nr:glycerol dehydratase reactivase beta/small subunit family protein [Propionibacteriaceae bacterium]
MDRPEILVFADSDSRVKLSEVLYGIEEEGVPYRVVEATGDAGTIAHQAAVESRLGVGVGAASGRVAVTTEKLVAAAPYISINLNASRAVDRAVGANAARLVKRIPLKAL